MNWICENGRNNMEETDWVDEGPRTGVITLSEEDRRILLAVCEDHRNCLSEYEVPLCGRATMERLRRHGIEPTAADQDEVEQKARLLWETTEMIRKLGGKV